MAQRAVKSMAVKPVAVTQRTALPRAVKQRWAATVLALGLMTGAAGASGGGVPVEPLSVEAFSHGLFQDAPVYRPAGAVQGVALLLSGPAGWAPADAALAEQLRQRGVFVAGIDLPGVVRALRADGVDCLGIQGDLDNFSRFLQARYQVPGYHPPLLVGREPVGSALAYGTLASAPADAFGGAVSLALNPAAVSLPLPACEDLAAVMRAPAAAAAEPNAYALQPATALPAPWVVFPAPGAGTAVAALAAAQPRATYLPAVLPPAGRLNQAWQRLGPAQSAGASLPAAVADLPLVEVPAGGPHGAHDVLAIMLSGDGGWAGIDKALAAALSRAGIPVVGFDSLRYFWQPRTPAGTADDLARIVGYYQSQPLWQRAQVLLIGYSQGADVLPFAIEALPPAVQTQLAQAWLIGLGPQATFEFHVSQWLGRGQAGLPTLPAAQRLPSGLALCVYGKTDADSICPQLAGPGSPVRVLGLPGGHHFEGDYDALAATLLQDLGAARPLAAKP